MENNLSGCRGIINGFLIVAALAAIAMILFSSCSEFMPGDGCFIVNDVIERRNGSKYQLLQTNGHGQTWIMAKVGQYHIGDTLRLFNVNCKQ